MENDLYQVISVLHRGDKTCVDVVGPRYRYRNSRGVPYYFLFWINKHNVSKRCLSALGWGLCTWFAALLVRVPLSIGASDLTGTQNLQIWRASGCGRRNGFEWQSSGSRVVFEIGVTFFSNPFILMGYDSFCRRGFQTP